MKSNSNYCFNHPKEYVGGIYIGKNNFTTLRKVCMVCVSRVGINPKQILAKDDFVQQLFRKSQNINMEGQFRQSNLKQNIKCLLNHLDNIQEEISQIIQSIKESILAIQACEQQMDNKFLNLIKEDLNPFECSNSELNFLVNFLEGNALEEWVKIKSSLIGKLKQTMFDLKNFKNGDQIYLKNGHILRIEKNCNRYKREEIIYNIEQLKHLVFQGQFGVKGNKIKQWKYFWKGKHVGGGFYSITGAKEGNWVDLCENYWDEKKILEIGCYSKGKRIGDWTFKFNDKQIGGGSYDQQGNQKKIGKWVELDENFYKLSQINDRTVKRSIMHINPYMLIVFCEFYIFFSLNCSQY